jgi:hypothetical protein
LEALVRHKVRFIILGGVAERMLGSPRTTDDFDISPAKAVPTWSGCPGC